MTALDIYFIATLWPVIVCVATAPKCRKAVPYNDLTKILTFDFAKGSLRNIFDDGILPQLGGGIDRMPFLVIHSLDGLWRVGGCGEWQEDRV
jgi:hypothetical protein